MSKRFVTKLRIEAESHDGSLCYTELLPESSAKSRFFDLIQLHFELGFTYFRVFRLLVGNHVIYEFSDKRKILK